MDAASTAEPTAESSSTARPSRPSMESLVAARDAGLAEHDAALAARDALIAERDAAERADAAEHDTERAIELTTASAPEGPSTTTPAAATPPDRAPPDATAAEDADDGLLRGLDEAAPFEFATGSAVDAARRGSEMGFWMHVAPADGTGCDTLGACAARAREGPRRGE